MFGYLISYHYYRRTDLDELAEAAGAPELTFFGDSGAFSAHTLGERIELEDYAAWLERWRHRIHVYASLDVLFDHEGTRRNTEAMRKLGFDPMPVFHLGSPLAAYERYLEESDYVAIGGMASGTLTMKDARLWKYLDLLHGKAERAGVRLHGFGLSSWPVIRRFPWYSIDSSTAGSGYRYGRCFAYDPYGDRWLWWALRDKQAWRRNGWLVREYGMTPEDFEADNVAIRSALIALAARSWSRAAKVLAGLTYITDTANGDRGGELGARERMAVWERGNRWRTRAYVAEGGYFINQDEGNRLGTYEQGNRWDTRAYIADPPAAGGGGKSALDRLAAWEKDNRWEPTEEPV